jgi:hypothetical protein
MQRQLVLTFARTGTTGGWSTSSGSNTSAMTSGAPKMLDRPSKDRGKANRWRRYRARRKAGRIVPIMPNGVGADEIELLVGTRWLAERDALTQDEIKVGITFSRLRGSNPPWLAREAQRVAKGL